MKAILLSVALLGQTNPYVRRLLDEPSPNRSYPQEQLVQEHMDQRQQYQNASDEKQAWIIGGAVIAGLVLLGLIARGTKK